MLSFLSSSLKKDITFIGVEGFRSFSLKLSMPSVAIKKTFELVCCEQHTEPSIRCFQANLVFRTLNILSASEWLYIIGRIWIVKGWGCGEQFASWMLDAKGHLTPKEKGVKTNKRGHIQP